MSQKALQLPCPVGHNSHDAHCSLAHLAPRYLSQSCAWCIARHSGLEYGLVGPRLHSPADGASLAQQVFPAAA